jgi:hypothetical protein
MPLSAKFLEAVAGENRWDEEREEQPEEDIAGVAVGGLDGDDARSIRTIVLVDSERIKRRSRWRDMGNSSSVMMRSIRGG